MLARALVVANGKEGVGKSSLVAGLSTAAASGGWKVLVVDLDPHGAVDLDLGYRQSGLTDEGESLFRSVVDGTPLQPLEGVRRNLDVIAGGGYTEALVDLMADRLRRGDPTAVQVVDGRLAEVAPSSYRAASIPAAWTGSSTCRTAITRCATQGSTPSSSCSGWRCSASARGRSACVAR